MTGNPTDLDTLRRYRAAHAGGPESQRVWLFHSHAYFDHAVPECVAAARAWMERIRAVFAETAGLRVHSFIPWPIGPHPRGSFEVLFTREAFADYVSWLMFERPGGIDVLVHPLTRSQTLDHTERALWLGTRREIYGALLEAVDARLVASGRSEESIIEGTKEH